MSPVIISLGGYAPPTSTHGRALDCIANRLRAEHGDAVDVRIEHDFLAQGRPLQELFTEVEEGIRTACYFSTSYLVGRVPELGVLDIPYLFRDLHHAHWCLDGPLGTELSAQTSARTALVPLGYWDNGFRHLSNRCREVRAPADLQGLSIRLQPNRIHEQLFRALGAEPVLTELHEGIARLRSGEIDAQENPLGNFTAYGLEKIHPYVTLTAHVYGARGFYASAPQIEAWPRVLVDSLRDAVRFAIAEQRIEAEAEEQRISRDLGQRGIRVIELSEMELGHFRKIAAPVAASAAQGYGPDLMKLVAE